MVVKSQMVQQCRAQLEDTLWIPYHDGLLGLSPTQRLMPTYNQNIPGYVISSFQDFSSCSYICIKVHLVEFEFIGQEPPDAAPIEGVFAVGHDHGLFIETLSHSLHDSLECFQESLLGHTLLSLIFLIKTRINDRFDNVAYYLKQ